MAFRHRGTSLHRLQQSRLRRAEGRLCVLKTIHLLKRLRRSHLFDSQEAQNEPFDILIQSFIDFSKIVF
jgi:hypothetical protein